MLLSVSSARQLWHPGCGHWGRCFCKVVASKVDSTPMSLTNSSVNMEVKVESECSLWMPSSAVKDSKLDITDRMLCLVCPFKANSDLLWHDVSAHLIKFHYGFWAAASVCQPLDKNTFSKKQLTSSSHSFPSFQRVIQQNSKRASILSLPESRRLCLRDISGSQEHHKESLF